MTAENVQSDRVEANGQSRSRKSIRKTVLPLLACRCGDGARLLIAPSGLVCENGCGRLLSPVEITGYDLDTLRTVLVIERNPKINLAMVPPTEYLAGQMELTFAFG